MVDMTWRLGHRPGLDGLRGIAVLLVLAGHAAVPNMTSAGGVGVTVFFTLSGFLITTLLLDDIDQHGRIRFGRFYRRRALRLFPAAGVLVAVVAVLGLITASSGVHQRTVLGSLFYASNYTVKGGAYDWLGHTWSLAIEEQFYLVWPLLLLGLLKLGVRQWVLAVLVFDLAFVSMWVRFSQYDHGAGTYRIYFWPDARADALLIGAAVAILIREVQAERTQWWLAALGAVPLAVALPWNNAVQSVETLPTFVALGTAAILWATAQGPGLAVLEQPWLRWVGHRSYGLYLWHYPVMIIAAHDLDWSWWQRAALTVPISFALTVLSWRYVEQPFLRMKDQASGDAEEVEERLDAAAARVVV